jgi:hypothetical protein
MNRANAVTRYNANAANIAAWHRKIRKAASRATQLEKEQERLKLIMTTLDKPEGVTVVPPPPVVTSESVELGVAQNLVDAGDYVGRGQTRNVAAALKANEGFVPVSNPPPIDWEHPEIAAQQVAVRAAVEPAPMVLPDNSLPTPTPLNPPYIMPVTTPGLAQHTILKNMYRAQRYVDRNPGRARTR